MEERLRSESFWRPFFWISLGAWSLLHIILASIIPVSGDEAYYWDCARHLDWSSFDQPLLMIWSMNPFRWILGETSLAVRSPAIIASALLGIVLLGLMRRLKGGYREATLAYGLLHAMPLFFLGSFYESTDIGMSVAYLAAAWAAIVIAQGDRRGWWGFGLATGLGFLAKFPVVLVMPALLPAFLRRSARQQLRTPTPWLAALLSAVLTTPVWIWALQHNWDNFRFQLQGRHKSTALGLKHLTEFIGANLLLATPFIILAILIALRPFLRQRSTERWSLTVAMLAPFMFFGLISLREGVGGHWGGPGLVVGAVILALTPFRGRKCLVGLGAFMGVGLSMAAIFVVSFPEQLMNFEWSYAGQARRINTRQLGRLLGNQELLAQLEAHRRPNEPLFFTSYSNTHLFALLSKGRLPTRLANIAGGSHGLASLYWYERDALLGKDLSIVSSKETKARAWLEKNCRSFEEEAPVEYWRGDERIRRLSVLRCHGLEKDGGLFGRGASSSKAIETGALLP